MLCDDEKLVIIGVDEETSLKISSRIVSVARTESMQELVMWYNIADVVLSLSKAETFGLTIAEGLACGTPAIVYDNTAQPELVSESTGYIVKEGDVKEVYDKIQLIKQGGNYYNKSCRLRAVQEFDKNKSFKKYVQLYEQLLKN